MLNKNVNVEKLIKSVKSSYGDKYTEQDFNDFKQFIKDQPNNKTLDLVCDLFDLDINDAKDMLKGNEK